MASYSHSTRFGGRASSEPQWGVLSPANNETAIVEFSITTLAPSAMTCGLGRSANVPTLRNGKSFVADNEAHAPQLSMAKAGTEFVVEPTVPAQFFRRFATPAQVGIGVAYTFPKGIILAAAGSALVLWNIAVSPSSTHELSCLIEE